MKQRKKKRKIPNPLLAEAMRGLRFSNAAVRHVPKPRKGTRRVKMRNAIRDSQQQ